MRLNVGQVRKQGAPGCMVRGAWCMVCVLHVWGNFDETLCTVVCDMTMSVEKEPNTKGNEALLFWLFCARARVLLESSGGTPRSWATHGLLRAGSSLADATPRRGLLPRYTHAGPARLDGLNPTLRRSTDDWPESIGLNALLPSPPHTAPRSTGRQTGSPAMLARARTPIGVVRRRLLPLLGSMAGGQRRGNVTITPKLGQRLQIDAVSLQGTGLIDWWVGGLISERIVRWCGWNICASRATWNWAYGARSPS